MWWTRKPKEVKPFSIDLYHHPLEVHHVIEKKPEPRPVIGYVIIANDRGEQWRTPPFHINGQRSYPISIYRSWLTGDHTDHTQISFELGLEY